MMKNLSSKTFFPISMQIFMVAFFASVILTVMVSVVTYNREVNLALESVETDLNFVSTTIAPNLSESLWQVDRNQAEMLFKSLKNLGSISQSFLFIENQNKLLKLVESDAEVVSTTLFEKKDTIEISEKLFRKINLSYLYQEKNFDLGTLIVVVDKNPILERAKSHFFSFMIYQIIGLLTVSSLLFLFVKKMYVHRTESLSGLLHSLTQDQFEVIPEKISTLVKQANSSELYFDEIDQQLVIVTEMLTKLDEKETEVKTSLHKVEELNSQILSASMAVLSGQLAVGLLHDINNLVMGISGGILSLESKIEKTGDQILLQNLGNVKKQMMAMISILKIHQSSAREESIFVKNQLRTVIDDAISIEKSRLQRYQVQLQDHTIGSEIEFWGLRPMVLSALINLFKNGVEAMQRSPGVHILSLHLQTDNDFCYLSVRDNGPGVPPESVDSLFTYGFTTKKEGHGFGLFSCKQNLKLFGGDLYLEAGRVNGASFTVKLPLKSAEPLALADGINQVQKKVQN